MHGLSGIPYTRALGKHQIVRPLLACRRFLIDAYQAAYEVPFRDDISNTDVSIRRNRLRHELLPLLRREYNESVDDALLRLTHIVKDEDAVLQAWAEEALLRVAQPIYRGVRWEIPAFQILPVALQRRCINLVLGQLGHLNPIEFSHVEAMRLFLLDEGKRRFRGSNHDMAWRVKDTVFYWTGFRDPGLEQAMSMEISGIGLYPIPGTPWQLSVERANSPTRYSRNHWETWIPWPEDAVVTVRNRKPGDRMHPLGMTGSQLLSDVLAEAKIPQPFRDQYPLLCVGSDIVWVPGVKRSRRHLVTELSAAPHVLRIVSEQDTYIFWEAVL